MLSGIQSSIVLPSRSKHSLMQNLTITGTLSHSAVGSESADPGVLG